LENACKIGNLEFVKYFLDNILNDYEKTYKTTKEINYELESAMTSACKNGQMEIIKFLFSQNLICNSFAVDTACSNGHIEVITYLCDQHRIPNNYLINCNSFNETCINILCDRGFK